MGALATDPLLGHLVDSRYDILRRIARGGMATVYLAHDRRLDRRVALKVMHPHLAEGTDVVARFRREARAAARLAHPGIVAVLDQGLDGETSYLTMEYVPGRTLRTEIAGHGALTLGQALTITDSVLDALAAAHRAGLVHRDVKPENVLLTREGSTKVGDFGLARAVTEATAANTGTLLGTVAYLSPEIVAEGTADARADVYAVGIMLYEMLTGAPPYEGSSPIQVAYRHVHEDVPPPSESVPWLPIEVDDLVAALTARETALRPADAAQALSLVRRVRSGLDERALALRARVPGRPELLVEVPEETGSTGELDDPVPAVEPADHDATRALDRGPGTGTIALPIGAVAPPSPPPTSPTEKVPVRRRRRRGRVAAIIVLLVLLLTGAGFALWWFLLGPGAPVTVPNVTGRNATEASAELRDLGLQVATTEVNDDVAPVGTVISMQPEPRTEVARDSVVTLEVSLGIEMVEMPVVLDLTPAEATQALTAAGFTEIAEPTERPEREESLEGLVVGSSLQPGEAVPYNTEVQLVVSSGPAVVEIDSDYVDVPADTARTELMDLLDIPEEMVSEEEAFSDTIEAGNVVSVSLASGGTVTPGTEVRQGTAVKLTVSKGPELFEVPRVVGRYRDEAVDILEDAGFKVAVETSWGGLFGGVVKQEPEAGAMVPRGTTVTITHT